jgi:dTDP-glucose 4,6-dehydratase
MITGCAGFIGSHAVERFLDEGWRVLGVDKMTYAGAYNWRFIEDLWNNASNFDFSLVKADICEQPVLLHLCERFKIDVIVNFAAETHVDRSIDNSTPFIHSNVDGVRSLLDVCRARPGMSFVQISTDEVVAGQHRPTEDAKMTPKNPYSASKAAAEHLIESYHNTYGVPAFIIRMTNNFGPRQVHEKLVPVAIENLLTGEPVPLYGEGEQKRTWMYVKDSASLIESLVSLHDFDKNSLDIINLSMDEADRKFSNVEMVKKLYYAMGIPKGFEEVVKFVEDRPGHYFEYSLNIAKLKILLWEEGRLLDDYTTDLSDALDETIEYYRAREGAKK